MSNESTNAEMTSEAMQLKIENQLRLIKQLTSENEELYHKFNHMLLRNNKYLMRIDDQQELIENLYKRIDDMQDRNKKLSNHKVESVEIIHPQVEVTLSKGDVKKIYEKWKNMPGQEARNTPNLKKQAQMLIQLYFNKALISKLLFDKTGIGSVTGARYVATLKKFKLIAYVGARKKGHYVITEEGKKFIESEINPVVVASQSQV